jgi:glycosyltransferase involved in cell wall biosynthesis
MSTEDCHSRFWSNGFGLAAENYKVIFAFDFMRKHGIHALYNKINKEIIENNISLLLIDISSPIYDPFIIFDLKQEYGLTVVLLALDDEFKFDWISSSYATIADLVLTLDYVSVNRYRQAGVNAHFFMHPIYIPHEVPEQSRNDLKYSVSFVGRVDDGKPSRVEFVRFLARNEIGVSYFKSCGANDPLYLSRDEMYSIYRNSAINLNFTGITTYLDKYNNVLYTRIRGMKLRPLEIIAAGGFCISEFSISLAKLLEDGVDIVFFRSKEELLEKIQYFLSHQDEAKRIAANGAKKITKQFSCEAVAKRLAELIQESQEYLGIDLYGEPHRVKVSRWLASSFISFTLLNSVTLLFKGRLLLFFSDFWHLVKFLRRLSICTDTLLALKLAFLALLKLGKDVLAKIISILLR